MSAAPTHSAATRGGICFVAPHAYPILAGDRQLAFIGGAEVQQVALARGFAARGFRVTMVCLDYGQADAITIDGIRVYRAHSPEGGIPVLRFLHPRLTSIWRAMHRADADLYYQRAASALTAFVVAFARANQRVSLFAAASDGDFEAVPPSIRFARDQALYRWGVRHANAVVVQNNSQSEACRVRIGRHSTLIGSCCNLGEETANHIGPVLWVGSVRSHKGPLAIIDLARRCPGLQFRVIGDGTPELMAELRAAANALGNIEIVGFVPFVDVEALFDDAFALINTSPIEGFPNTFLQAWSRGIPSVSFVDPGVLHLGVAVAGVVSDTAAMADQLQSWRRSQPEWRAAGHRARAYAQEHFGVDTAVSRYEAVIQPLAPQIFADDVGAAGRLVNAGQR
jgi:glycosyltransferase involved in cell wall biosynthesis